MQTINLKQYYPFCNPHVHIMLTLRPLKENGQWGAKCRKAYDLDENGQRIPDGKGGWKNHREDTTDWNDKGNVERKTPNALFRG